MSDEPEKVELASPDLAAQARVNLAQLFPGVLADGVLDATKLAELLDTEVAVAGDTRERYGLMWAGKAEAIRSLQTPSRGTLVPDLDRSVDWDTAQNVFIEGDNLEVLKLLQKAYNDKVKLIYIDPPYNTGNDFVYEDNFGDTTRGYLEWSGQLDTEGRRISTGSDTAGRKHSRWLSMMLPRLVLARNLLAQDGVLFVSIDDNEAANLKELLDEVFGPENFIATVIWQKVYSPMNSATQFASVHDYLHVYARNAAEWVPNLLPRTEEQDEAYKNPDNDARGRWKAVDATAAAGHATPSQFYELVTPAGNRFTPPPGRAWLYTEPRYQEMLADDRVWFGKDGRGRPAIKRFITEVKQGRVAQTFWPYTEVGHNQDAKKELLSRVKFVSGDSVFDTPKPTKLIRQMLTMATNPHSYDVVLDFFAGSGSTADAVIQQNGDDGGNRRYIAVQIPELTGYSDYPAISDITFARITAARAEVEGGERGGLRTLRLVESAFHQRTADSNTIDLSDTTLRDVLDPLGAAAEILIKEGVPLDATWTHSDAAGAPVIAADGVAVVLTLDLTDQITAAALAQRSRVLVFLEDGFAGRDAVKANAFTNAKQLGIKMKTV